MLIIESSMLSLLRIVTLCPLSKKPSIDLVRLAVLQNLMPLQPLIKCGLKKKKSGKQLSKLIIKFINTL